MPGRQQTPDGARAPVDSSPESAESVARGVVLRRLSVGARTRAQLREAILAKDVPGEVADQVLDRFTELRLVNDADFAVEWVRSRHRGKGLSRQLLAMELRRKGVAEQDAEPALAMLDDDDERAAAEALVRKKLSSSQGLEPRRRASRLMGVLARKGYGGSLAAEVVRRALATERDDDPSSRSGAGGSDSD